MNRLKVTTRFTILDSFFYVLENLDPEKIYTVYLCEATNMEGKREATNCLVDYSSGSNQEDNKIKLL